MLCSCKMSMCAIIVAGMMIAADSRLLWQWVSTEYRATHHRMATIRPRPVQPHVNILWTHDTSVRSCDLNKTRKNADSAADAHSFGAFGASTQYSSTWTVHMFTYECVARAIGQETINWLLRISRIYAIVADRHRDIWAERSRRGSQSEYAQHLLNGKRLTCVKKKSHRSSGDGEKAFTDHHPRSHVLNGLSRTNDIRTTFCLCRAPKWLLFDGHYMPVIIVSAEGLAIVL